MSVPASLESARDGFLEALRIQRFSPKTLKVYGYGVGVFFAFLAEQNIADVREVDRATIRAYQHWLAGKAYSDETRASQLQSVRRFFEHLEKTDAILINPCAEMILPKIAKRLPRGVLTREEARRVLNAPDTQTPLGLRDKAILEVLYSTGLRLAELTRLSVFDVDHRNGFVRVNQGKGGKDRVVPLGRKACDYVREYLARVRSEWTKTNRDERALWLSWFSPHGPLGSPSIELLVKQYGRAAGLRVTPHLWRHTCATHLVANGASIAAVQRQLGHKSLRTTQRYTRVAVPELVAMHQKAHPLNRRRKS
jgi:integrase/recombinase XerD